MPRRSTGLALVVSLASYVSVHAQAPVIREVAPYGVQRGVPTEITLQGTGLGPSSKILASFDLQAVPSDPKSTLGALRKIKVTAAPETPVGVHLIRVRTEDGISNPFLFAVGQFPQVAEKEENSTFETAQVIPLNSVVEGQSAGNDVDFFKFTGKKGQRVLIDAQCARIGSGVDPTVRLTTASRTYVGSADDTAGLLTDARFSAVLPEDTNYVIELSDSRYQGGGRPIYRLVVAAAPTADEIYPLGGRQGETLGLELRGGTLPPGRIAAATLRAFPGTDIGLPRLTGASLGLTGPEAALDVESVSPMVVSRVPEVRENPDPKGPPSHGAAPVVFNGRIEAKGDEDSFVVKGVAGQRLKITVEASTIGSALDGVLEVKGANGGVLASADDVPNPLAPKGPNNQPAAINSPDPSLVYTVSASTPEITLNIKDLKGDGGVGFPYRIVVEPVTVTSFELTLGQSEISLPKGGSAAIPVTVVRQGFNGPITLNVANPPAGVTVRPGTINDGQLLGVLTLSATNDVAFDVEQLKVVGEGKAASGLISVEAKKPIILAQQATLPTNVLILDSIAAASAPASGIQFETPATPIEVAHGFGGNVPVKVTRGKDADGAVALAALPLPPGFTVPAGTIAAKANEGAATVNAAVEAPLGNLTIALNGKGKFAGKDQTLALPAINLSVVRPAVLELATAKLELKPGATAEVKGKLIRKGTFKEPVAVKLDGLPAGVKADAVTVAPDKAEFVVKLTADAKAAAATGAAKVTPAFQANKKDYPSPSVPLEVKVVPAK